MDTATGGQEEKDIHQLRVLIADDAQETRRGTRLMLALNPEVKIVAIAHDGQQAVEMAKELLPDIAIVDINMPKMDGISAIRAMLNDQPDMCCMVISVEWEEHILQEALAAGAIEYLIKPFTVDEMNQAIEHLGERVLATREQEHILMDLAEEYIRTRLTDDQAVDVLEKLAAKPGCDLRWLANLGIIYMLRQDWGKLKRLAGQMEERGRFNQENL